jgi:hypothetical protein
MPIDTAEMPHVASEPGGQRQTAAYGIIDTTPVRHESGLFK